MAALLVHIGDSPQPERFRDGGIMQAHDDHVVGCTHAELIVNGRGIKVSASVKSVLWSSWRRTRKGPNGWPDEAGVAGWWTFCESMTTLRREDLRFPFSRIEQARFLAVPLTSDLTAQQVSDWPGKESKFRFNWRKLVRDEFVRRSQHVVGPVITEAEMLAGRDKRVMPVDPSPYVKRVA